MRTYSYTVLGTAADEQTWEVSGSIQASDTPDVVAVTQEAFRRVFDDLTGRRAVYGHPGIGCHGPYTVSSWTIKLEG